MRQITHRMARSGALMPPGLRLLRDPALQMVAHLGRLEVGQIPPRMRYLPSANRPHLLHTPSTRSVRQRLVAAIRACSHSELSPECLRHLA